MEDTERKRQNPDKHTEEEWNGNFPFLAKS